MERMLKKIPRDLSIIFALFVLCGCETTMQDNDDTHIITTEGIYAAYPYNNVPNSQYGYLPASYYPRYSIPVYSGRSYNPKYYYGRHYNPYYPRNRYYYPKYYNIRDKGSRVYSPNYKSSRYR